MLNKYNLYYRTFLVLFWGAMCWGFVTEEFLTFLAPLENAFFLLMDVVLLVLGLVLLRRKKDLAILLSFCAIALVSTVVVNRLSFFTLFNGSRDFFGIIFVVPILAFFLSGERASEFKASFDKQLRIWMFVQAFCLVWQIIRYGANDHGGGSMGYGASGMVSMLMYLVSYYLTIQNWDFNDYWGSFKRNKWNIILLLATYLNETKISFVLLVLYFLLLYRPSRNTILKLVYILPIIVVALIGIGNLYLRVTNQEADKVLTWEFFSDYLAGSDMDDKIELAYQIQDGYFDDELETAWILDIERLAKLQLIVDPLEKTNGGLLLGAGLGQFKGGTIVSETPFMRTNKWLLQGSRPWVFTIFVQLGFVGLIWFFSAFYFDCYHRVSRTSSLTRLYLFLTACMAFMLIYNEAFRYYYFCIVYFYLFFAIRLVKAPESKEEEV